MRIRIKVQEKAGNAMTFGLLRVLVPTAISLSIVYVGVTLYIIVKNIEIMFFR